MAVPEASVGADVDDDTPRWEALPPIAPTPAPTRARSFCSQLAGCARCAAQSDEEEESQGAEVESDFGGGSEREDYDDISEDGGGNDDDDDDDDDNNNKVVLLPRLAAPCRT